MKCENCGYGTNNNEDVCPYCGTILKKVEVVKKEKPQQTPLFIIDETHNEVEQKQISYQNGGLKDYSNFALMYGCLSLGLLTMVFIITRFMGYVSEVMLFSLGFPCILGFIFGIIGLVKYEEKNKKIKSILGITFSSVYLIIALIIKIIV